MAFRALGLAARVLKAVREAPSTPFPPQPGGGGLRGLEQYRQYLELVPFGKRLPGAVSLGEGLDRVVAQVAVDFTVAAADGGGRDEVCARLQP